MKFLLSNLPPEEQFQVALTRSLKLLSYRPRTEKEIRDSLAKREFSPSIIDQTIDLLKKDKLINDKEFAEWWIQQRQEFKPKGKIVLKQELQQKGVDRTLAEQEVEVQDDFEIAKELFEKKKSRFERYSGEEYKKKVHDYFARRGFSFDLILKLLKGKNNT